LFFFANAFAPVALESEGVHARHLATGLRLTVTRVTVPIVAFLADGHHHTLALASVFVELLGITALLDGVASRFDLFTVASVLGEEVTLLTLCEEWTFAIARVLIELLGRSTPLFCFTYGFLFNALAEIKVKLVVEWTLFFLSAFTFTLFTIEVEWIEATESAAPLGIR